MQIPSAIINNAFDVQPSEELTKEASYKEKSILQSSQEESGEEKGKLNIFMPCLIYVKRVFTFQKAFSVGLVPRYVFGGLESTLWILKYFQLSGIQLTYKKELHESPPLLPKHSSSAPWIPLVRQRWQDTLIVSSLLSWWLRCQTTKLTCDSCVCERFTDFRDGQLI